MALSPWYISYVHDSTVNTYVPFKQQTKSNDDGTSEKDELFLYSHQIITIRQRFKMKGISIFMLLAIVASVANAFSVGAINGGE